MYIMYCNVYKYNICICKKGRRKGKVDIYVYVYYDVV